MLLATKGQLLVLVLQVKTKRILGECVTAGHRNNPLTDSIEAFLSSFCTHNVSCPPCYTSPSHSCGDQA